jgi:hypothetical protein
VRSRLPLAAIFLAVILASCGGRPGVNVTLAGVSVPMVLASASEGTACSSSIGDAFPQNTPLTTVRGSTRPIIHVEADQGATEIRGFIYDVDAPSPSGGPNEEFTLPGRSGSYEMSSILPAHTYQVLVNVRWSFVVTQGEVTHLFKFRVEPG